MTWIVVLFTASMNASAWRTGWWEGLPPSLCDWSVLCRTTLCFLPGLWWLAQNLGSKINGAFSFKPSHTTSDSWQKFLSLLLSVLHCPLGVCNLKRRLDPDPVVKFNIQPKHKLNIASNKCYWLSMFIKNWYNKLIIQFVVDNNISWVQLNFFECLLCVAPYCSVSIHSILTIIL